MKKICIILIIIVFVLLGGLFGLGLIVRTISNKTIARDRATVFTADLTQSELKAEDIIFSDIIELPESKTVHLNNKIRLYAKMHSHHTWQIHGGYTFLNINGKVYHGSGPCGDGAITIQLPSKPIEDVKEAELVEVLIEEGYHEIQSNGRGERSVYSP